LQSARESIRQALALVEKSEIEFAAWQVYATAWQLHQRLKERQTAETNRQRAEASILKIADSFDSHEPLRATFLAAANVRQVLSEKAVHRPSSKHELGRVAAY
jgi:hypothetical protein